MKTRKTTVALVVASTLGAIAATPVSAGVIIADGYYDMVINATPTITTPYGPFPNLGSDGAWNSSFTFSCVPGSKGCGSQAMYDNTSAAPANGKYSGVPNDGVAGTVSIKVQGGVITGTGTFQVDTIFATCCGDFVQYTDTAVQPVNFTGSVDSSGNLTFTPTGRLGTFGSFPSTVDKRWNVDNYNGATGSTPNPFTGNTSWTPFSTGSASNAAGTINGAQVTSAGGSNYQAILVSAAQVGGDYGGIVGVSYFEAWNVQLLYTAPVSTVPLPAAAWLFLAGLAGVAGTARRRGGRHGNDQST